MVELLRKLKRALVAWRERAKVRSEAARAFRYDERQFMANAGAQHLDRMAAARAEIVMGYHVLEKGLTMPRLDAFLAARGDRASARRRRRSAGTPGLGIAHGSKLANWLSNFGSTVEGSVYDCDWNKVTEHVLAAIKNRGDWDAVRARAYAELTSRLETARGELIALLKGDGI